MVSLPLMRRHLCRNGVVALILMALLPSPMHRRLAVVHNNGNGVSGDDNDDNFDDVMDFATIAMALLPSSQWRDAVADAQVSCCCRR